MTKIIFIITCEGKNLIEAMRKAGDVSCALEDCDIVNKGITVCARVYEDYEYVVTLTDGTTTNPNIILGTTTEPSCTCGTAVNCVQCTV